MNAKYLNLILLLSPSVYAMEQLRVPQVIADATIEANRAEVHKTTSAHRIHDVESLRGTVTDDEGKETKIEIVQDKLHESDQDNTRVQMSRRRFIMSHAANTLITGLVMTGVTLAIKYADCKK